MCRSATALRAINFCPHFLLGGPISTIKPLYPLWVIITNRLYTPINLSRNKSKSIIVVVEIGTITTRKNRGYVIESVNVLNLYLLWDSICPTVLCAILDAKKIFFNGVQGNII